MIAEIEQLTHQLGRLPASSRAFLADWLAQSLESESDPVIEAEWNAVADQRWQEIRAGTVAAVPVDEAFSRARASLLR